MDEFAVSTGGTTRLVMTPTGGRTVGSGLARRRFRAARLEDDRAPLAPRSALQILDAGCELFASRFAPLLAVGFLLWVPALFAQSMLLRGGEDLAFFIGTPLIGVLVQVMAAGYTCALVGATLQGRRTSASQALLATLVRTPGLFVTAIAVAVLSTVLFCIMPVVLWLFAVVPAVYVIERCSLLTAVKRGISLVTTGSAFLRWMSYRVLGFLMAMPFTVLQDGLRWPPAREKMKDVLAIGGPPLDLAIAVLGAPYLAIATAFLAVVEVVFYFDLRVRREGYDLDRRLQAKEDAEVAA